MMNKVKKALIVAAVFIVVGIIGCIISGFYAVPQVISEVYRFESEIKNAAPIEREAFVTEEIVEALDISDLNSMRLDVEVKPSIDNNTRVKVYEYYDKSINVDTFYDSSSKNLVVKGQRNVDKFFDYKNLKGLVKKVYGYILENLIDAVNSSSKIVIEVPTGVDINFNGSDNSNLIVKEPSVLKDNLRFSAYYGYVDLPLNNNLKNIDITTDSYLEIDLREFINADKVNINSYDLYITSRGGSGEYENVTKLPEEVNIFSQDVTIKTFLPLGKNVIITSDHVEYDSNFENYPINLKLRGYDESSAYYTNRFDVDNKAYIENKNFEGILGDKDTSEHNLTITRYFTCDIENLTDLELEKDLR